MPAVDQHDYKRLLEEIYKQALGDYIKLQHPKYRQKKYLMDAFMDAIDMFFDDEYRMLHLQNHKGQDMSLKDFIEEWLDMEGLNMSPLREFVVKEAQDFWDKKRIKTLDIPETLQVNGHVYRVIHKEVDEPVIDFKDKTVTMDKNQGSRSEEQVVLATTELVLHHEEIIIARKYVKPLAKTWFRTLKLNNCFTGAT